MKIYINGVILELPNASKQSYIDQVLVLGDQRNFISALIVPSYDNLNKYMTTLDKDKLSNEALVDHPLIIELLNGEVSTIMEKFSHYEKIKEFRLVANPFSIEKGEMTPKMSIVRKRVINNYEDLIESIYN